MAGSRQEVKRIRPRETLGARPFVGAGMCGSVVERIPSMCEALGSTFIIAKTKTKTKQNQSKQKWTVNLSPTGEEPASQFSSRAEGVALVF